ncbi:hypothetical protein Pan153_39240 [Gimesia panareensis]|uniref:Uncharacterized protein n=2 Tax=Gimesia panareensis TaxID=2527978 RepID=A0A518FSE1_9PLAN|nr:hypothetical protein Pan153_39240 [Gimesia panareensis]
MVIPMHVSPKQTERSHWYNLLVLSLVTVFFSQGPEILLAQDQEAGSATVKEAAQAEVDLPEESAKGDEKSDKEKKDERPRELGVMILIVWVLAGAGIGILIFTSLFGHSVRSMIRRPYPPQSHGSPQPPREEVPLETEGESETVEKDPPQS